MAKRIRMYTVRLYSRNDLDLVTLHQNDPKFNQRVVEILSDYAKGKKPVYPINSVIINTENIVDDKNRLLLKTVQLHLRVDINKYPEVIELMDSIRDKYGCDFIKCIVKNAIPFPISNLYFTEIKGKSEIFSINDSENYIEESNNDKADENITSEKRKSRETSNNKEKHKKKDKVIAEKDIGYLETTDEVSSCDPENTTEEDDNFMNLLNSFVCDY